MRPVKFTIKSRVANLNIVESRLLTSIFANNSPITPLQVVFHVATMMPTRKSDAQCNGKKRHIGNNYVTIVYNESEEVYDINTIKVTQACMMGIFCSINKNKQFCLCSTKMYPIF